MNDLPPTVDTRTAADLLGVSADLLWRLVREEPASLPVAPLRLGRTLRWPTAPLLRSVGIDPERASGPASTTGPEHTTSHVAHDSEQKDSP